MISRGGGGGGRQQVKREGAEMPSQVSNLLEKIKGL